MVGSKCHCLEKDKAAAACQTRSIGGRNPACDPFRVANEIVPQAIRAEMTSAISQPGMAPRIERRSQQAVKDFPLSGTSRSSEESLAG